jgi:hypothetical protein
MRKTCALQSSLNSLIKLLLSGRLYPQYLSIEKTSCGYSETNVKKISGQKQIKSAALAQRSHTHDQTGRSGTKESYTRSNRPLWHKGVIHAGLHKWSSFYLLLPHKFIRTEPIYPFSTKTFETRSYYYVCNMNYSFTICRHCNQPTCMHTFHRYLVRTSQLHHCFLDSINPLRHPLLRNLIQLCPSRVQDCVVLCTAGVSTFSKLGPHSHSIIDWWAARLWGEFIKNVSNKLLQISSRKIQ